MKKSLLIAMLFFGCFLSAQNGVNQYQYVILPAQFKFLNHPDEYRLNTLTKLLLEKYGFKVFFDNDTLPTKLTESRCDKLYADVESSGSFIVTKMQVTLKDCKNNLVYQSATGKSKEKEYRVAYTQALREAFQSFESLQYHYSPKTINTEIPKIQAADSMSVAINRSVEKEEELLYAQPIANGFQLVDATPKVILKILKTSNPAIYTVIKGNVTGVLISKDNQWFFEYYQDEKPISEKINIKF